MEDVNFSCIGAAVKVHPHAAFIEFIAMTNGPLSKEAIVGYKTTKQGSQKENITC